MRDHRTDDLVSSLENRRTSRRRFNQGLLASTLGLATTAAASRWHAIAQSNPPEGELNVIVWGAGADIDSQVNAANKYMELFPQVKININPGDCGVNFPACKTLIAGDTMPDVFVPGIWNYNAMIDSDVLEDLEPYIQADRVEIADFNSKSIESLKALSNEKLYGLPMGYNCQSLYYNLDMFDAAGLEYPDPSGNYTYEDVRAWAKKLTLDENGNNAESPDFDAARITQWGLHTGAVAASIPNSDHILLAFGGSYMNLPDRQTCNLEHPDSIRAWQFVQDLMYVDKTVVGRDANQEQAGYLRWITGQVAMQTGSHEQVTFVNEQNPSLRYDMAALPKDKAGNATNVQYHIWSLYKGSEKKDLAWHLIRWLATDGSVYGNDEGTAPLMGLIPVYKDFAEGPAFLENPREPEHLKEAQLDPTSWKLCVFPTGYNQKTDDIGGQDGWGPAIDEILSNSKPAAEALAGINEKINNIMQQ